MKAKIPKLKPRVRFRKIKLLPAKLKKLQRYERKRRRPVYYA